MDSIDLFDSNESNMGRYLQTMSAYDLLYNLPPDSPLFREICRLQSDEYLVTLPSN